jgi:hypothetical protein
LSVFCPVGYTKVPSVQYQCVLEDACPAGYAFGLNAAGSPTCSK